MTLTSTPLPRTGRLVRRRPGHGRAGVYNSPGQHRHSALSLPVIGGRSSAIYTVILLSFLSFSAKMTAASPRATGIRRVRQLVVAAAWRSLLRHWRELSCAPPLPIQIINLCCMQCYDRHTKHILSSDHKVTT